MPDATGGDSRLFKISMPEQNHALLPKTAEAMEVAEKSAGAERYRLIYREAKAEEMGLATPQLGAILAEEDDFLKRLGVSEKLVHSIVARVRDKTLRRWGSELNALGSLLDLMNPELHKRLDAEIEEGLRAEVAKKAEKS